MIKASRGRVSLFVGVSVCVMLAVGASSVQAIFHQQPPPEGDPGNGNGSLLQVCDPYSSVCPGLPPCNASWTDSHCEYCTYYIWSATNNCYLYWNEGVSCPPPGGLCSDPPLCV